MKRDSTPSWFILTKSETHLPLTPNFIGTELGEETAVKMSLTV